jgi:hypothetical protein
MKLLCIGLCIISSFGVFLFHTRIFADEVVSFPDVTPDKWFYDNVTVLVDKGIINGYPDGTFKPYEDIYVDAFIKMVVTAMGNSARESTTGYWADPYIDMARTLTLIFDGEFDTFQRPFQRSLPHDMIHLPEWLSN